jgi:hypothetical protein
MIVLLRLRARISVTGAWSGVVLGVQTTPKLISFIFLNYFIYKIKNIYYIMLHSHHEIYLNISIKFD